MYVLCFSSSAYASIAPIDSIQELRAHTEESNNVLVVFDIDDTLTILEDPAFHRTNFRNHHAAAFLEILSTLSEKEVILTFSIPLLTTGSNLIEKETPEFIEKLHENGIRTIALTAAMGGEIDGVSIADRRIAELQRVGVDFSKSFPHLSEMVFSGFKAPLFGGHPLFKKGVILANDNDKGLVLAEFLKAIDWRPDLILFIDDRIDHIHAVKRAMEAFCPAIECKGFHYQTKHVPYEQIGREDFTKKWLEIVEMTKKASKPLS